MPHVELIYDADCPNVTATREQLLRAFAVLGKVPRWLEWKRADVTSPAHVRDYASPTILVNGCDVAQSSPIAGQGACRVYADESGRLSGVPALEAISSALSKSATPTSAQSVPTSNLKASLAALPAVGFALLPKLRGPDESVLRAAGLGQSI